MEENTGIFAGIIAGVIALAIGVALCSVCALLVIGGEIINIPM